MTKLYQSFYILEGRFEKDSLGNDYYVEDEFLIYEMEDIFFVHNEILNHLDINYNLIENTYDIDFNKIKNLESLIETLEKEFDAFDNAFTEIHGEKYPQDFEDYILDIAGLIKALKVHSIYGVYYETNIKQL